MKHQLVISHVQIQPLFKHRKSINLRSEISFDLGLSKSEIVISLAGITIPGGNWLSWNNIEVINSNKNNCFIIENGDIRKVLLYSELTDRLYSLMPTSCAPTMLISGIPMHRIKDTDPYSDTVEKVKTLSPIKGKVLDTSTGLGYTAIQASKYASHVTTIELDPAVLDIARINPWSQELFNNPNIRQITGNSFYILDEIESASFSCIIHDPPAFSLAGELYSKSFYQKMYRVMKKNGRLFHYIGNPHSKTGQKVTIGVIKRLSEVGFTNITRCPYAFGVRARK
jgi:predicted methyltransferase